MLFVVSSRGQGQGFERQLQQILHEGPQLQTRGEDKAPGIPNQYQVSGHQLATQEQSPLGIELGEFFMDGDLNFLNDHMFNFGQ